MSFRKRTCGADENDEGTTQKGVPEAMSQNGFKLEGHCCSAAEDWSQAQGKAHAPVEKKSSQLRRSGDWGRNRHCAFRLPFPHIAKARE